MVRVDRRTFLTAAMVAGPSLTSELLAQNAQGSAAPSQAAAKRIFVESEFAPLRTVVLTQSEAGGGPFGGSETPRRRRGRTGEQAGPPPFDQQKWEAERDAFRVVLEKYGVEVLRPRLFTAAEKEAGHATGYTNFFVRDPWFTVGSFVIEGSLRFFHRRLETLPCREIFESRVYPADCIYVSVPQPPAIVGRGKPSALFPGLDIDRSPGPFIEGGDVLVWGKRIYVGNSGLASSDRGIEWLRKLLAPHGYTVETVRLKANTLHLDCALGMVREGLMTVCDEVLPEDLPKSLRDWTRIAVTEPQALRLGTNGFPINPNVYVTDPEFRGIGDQIEKHGVKVEYVDFPISRGFGGSFRCSTQPLWRET
jgi:glycine amidinotransferase